MKWTNKIQIFQQIVHFNCIAIYSTQKSQTNCFLICTEEQSSLTILNGRIHFSPPWPPAKFCWRRCNTIVKRLENTYFYAPNTASNAGLEISWTFKIPIFYKKRASTRITAQSTRTSLVWRRKWSFWQIALPSYELPRGAVLGKGTISGPLILFILYDGH